jgi:hypothetical protein
MKKFAMICALVGMIAAPAVAGLAPEAANLGPNPSYNHATKDIRSFPNYLPNDPLHVYDHMATQLGLNGPEAIAFVVQQNATSRAIWNHFVTRPGATAISSIHMLVDQRILGSAVVTFALYNANLAATNASTVVGSMLLTTGGTSAIFQLPTAVAATINLVTLQFPPVAVAGGTDYWIGFQSNSDVRFFLDSKTVGVNPDLHNDPGDGNPTALHIGSQLGLFATCYGSSANPCGVGLFQQSQITTVFSFSNALGLMYALGGTPEPASICLLAAGLFALRRRKVKA